VEKNRKVFITRRRGSENVVGGQYEKALPWDFSTVCGGELQKGTGGILESYSRRTPKKTTSGFPRKLFD